MNYDNAELIAIRAVQFVTADSDLLERFLTISGLSPEDLRVLYKTAGFWLAALEFLRQNETDCLVFSSNTGLSPQEIEQANLILAGSVQNIS